MEKLVLAENSGFMPGLSQTAKDNYIYIPAEISPTGSGFYAREDTFDNLTNEQYAQVLDVLEPFQQGLGLFGFGNKVKKLERKEQRAEIKTKAKTDKITARGAAKATARAAGGGAVENIFSKVADTVGGIFGGTGTIEGVTPEPLPPPTKEWYKNPLIYVAGGAGVLLLIFVLSKKKGKK